MMGAICGPDIKEKVKAKALELGFDLVGIAPASRPPHYDAYASWVGKGYHGTMDYLERHLSLKESPQGLLPGCRSAIVVALNYNQSTERLPGQAKIARYALGRDYHKVLKGKLRELEAWLKSVEPGAQTRACVDSAPIIERDFAQLAGLGWFGKNTMIINSRKGSWFFLGVLLTTIELQPDEPAVGFCGTCTRCVEACPTGALVFEEERWQVDARRCISYLTIEHDGEIDAELQASMNDWTFGCDVCQEVCPFNEPRETQHERAAETSVPDFRKIRSWPTLQELSVIQEEDWDLLTRGSATRRTGVAGLRRNALINLRNLAASPDAEKEPACEEQDGTDDQNPG